MRLGEVQIDMTPESHDFEVGEDTIKITGKPNTPSMRQRAVRRASPMSSPDGSKIDVMSSIDSQAEQLVDIIVSWDGVEAQDGKPLGCNNETKRQLGREYPMTASDIVGHYNDLYEKRLKAREEAQGN
jgi:hypothetical protein